MSEGSAINSAAGNRQAYTAARDMRPTPNRPPAQIGGRGMQAGTGGAPTGGLKIASTPKAPSTVPTGAANSKKVLPEPLGTRQNAPLKIESLEHEASRVIESPSHKDARIAPKQEAKPALNSSLLRFDPSDDAVDEPKAARPRPARMGARQEMPSVLMSTRFDASVRTDTTSIDTRTDSRKWEFAAIPKNELEGLTATETMDKHRAGLADLHPDLGVPMEQDAAHEINENTELQQFRDLENKRSAEEYLDKALKPKSTMRQLWEMLPWVRKT